jgi:hypothetical protein
MNLRSTYPNLPAVPVDAVGALDTLARLSVRIKQEIPAKQGLTQRYTINGVPRTAYAFLFGTADVTALDEERQRLASALRARPDKASAELSRRARSPSVPAGAAAARPMSLERPEQFSISWTNFPNVYETGLPFLPEWASSLTDADSATSQFWPMIAQHGYGYNLIIPEKVAPASARGLRAKFGAAWTPQVRAASISGNLYVIDMSRLEVLRPQSVNGAPRFTPATITLLIRDPRSKSLTPAAIIVSGYKGRGRRVYARKHATDGAWLYALQAAKASITLFGVWLGHVYHWHIVTAAMQMTMLNTLSPAHPIYRLLAPQSKYAIPFDDVLLSLWSQLAPATSLASAADFLGLANDYAAGRSYFADDPKTTLATLRLRQKDFTVDTPWDRYPVVQRLLSLWDLVAAYVKTFVRTTYRSDAAVAGDQSLQAWIATANSPNPTTGGNVRGLTRTNSRVALERVLTSLLYRITVHGMSYELDLEPRAHVRAQLSALPAAHRHPEPARRDRHQGATQLPTEHRHDQPGGHVLLHVRVLDPLPAIHPAGRRQHRALLSRRDPRTTRSRADRSPQRTGGVHEGLPARHAPALPVAAQHRDVSAAANLS